MSRRVRSCRGDSVREDLARGPRLFLLGIPLLPCLAAGGVEAEQDLELGVGLLGLVGPQIALDQERPRLKQTRG